MKATKYKKSTANEHTKAAKEQMEALVSFKFHSFGHFSNGGRSDMDPLVPKSNSNRGVGTTLYNPRIFILKEQLKAEHSAIRPKS